MTPRQKEVFFERTGFQEFENYIVSLRDAGKSEIEITDAEYWLWETGFASFMMDNYEYVAITEGIRVEF